MIKFDRDEFLNTQIYSTNDEYETRCRVTNEVINDIKNLQQRISDAIEYIKDLLEHWRGNDLVERDLKILLEILRGENE